MGLLKDFYNGFMAIPSSPQPQANHGYDHSPKKLDLRNGNYQDPSRFQGDFRHRVQQDLKDTLRDSSTRSAVAGLFYESRGGSGISRGEIKSGLQRLVKQGKINENQMWAVRNKYGIY